MITPYRYLIFVFLLSQSVFGQFSLYSIIDTVSFRVEDFELHGDSLMFVAAGSSGNIYRSVDRGLSWEKVFDGDNYTRAVAIATPDLIFCGTLDSSFYRSTDGGETWEDIIDEIPLRPSGICGLDAPTATHIYGCGAYYEDPKFIKSTDGGQTWTTQDLSGYFRGLVEVHFLDSLRGFVAGSPNLANPGGGLILYTPDGGQSWTEVFRDTVRAGEVWKLQTPDGIHFFGTLTSVANPAVIRSNDGGMTWDILPVPYTVSMGMLQMVGFMNPFLGWIGGHGSGLMQTEDGGLTWLNLGLSANYNRFLKVNDTTAWLGFTSGLYEVVGGTNISVPEVKHQPAFEMELLPNPASEFCILHLNFARKTTYVVHIINEQGKLVATPVSASRGRGAVQHRLDLSDLPVGVYHVVVHANEGREVAKLLVAR